MIRSLRLRILVPRLLAVVVLLLAAQYGLGLAVRSIAVHSGEAAVGARVELAHARVSMLNRQLVLSDLRCANPLRPSENLFEADRCELDFATGPLLHKQAVVESGQVTGLRFATLRESAPDGSCKANEADAAVVWFRGDTGTPAREWLGHLAERFQPTLIDQFASVQRTEAFCANWSTRSAALDARGQELDRRATKLQQAFDEAQANPLRNDAFFDELPKKIAALQQEFADFRAEIEKLPDLLETERRAIVAARRQDEELSRNRLRVDPIESEAFTAYLLRDEVSKPLSELVSWLRWIREVVPADARPHQTQNRGQDILFAGCRPEPGMLIHALGLQGAARIGGQPVELRGLLRNVSSEPWLHNEPIRLQLRTTGSMPLELQATVDRTGKAAREELIVDCQGIVFSPTSLGRSDQLEMSIAPSVGSLSVSLAVTGDKLTGDIQLVQQNVRITPVVGNGLNGVPLARALQDTLSHFNSLATHVSLGGTLREPTCTLWSNLGPAVAEAIERALDKVGDQHARDLLVDAGRRSDEQLADVERQIMEQQARLTARINSLTATLQNVAVDEKPHYRISPERLGHRLPKNSLFR